MCGISKVLSQPGASRSGFTLLELVIVIALAAIILGIAVPVMRRRGQAQERTQWLGQLTALVQLGYLEALRTQEAHRIFFNMRQKNIQLERSRTKKTGESSFAPLKQEMLATAIPIPAAFELKNFYIRGRDEMSAQEGRVTDTVWFYITPGGAQAVTLNIVDYNEHDSTGNPKEFGMVLNPFTLQFTVYDEFQQP